MIVCNDFERIEQSLPANLFDLPGQALPPDRLQRRLRTLACLRFCRNVAGGDLPDAGLQTARRLLKQALRCHRRSRRNHAEALEDMLENALRALGDTALRSEESAEVAALRHWVEREMEAAARARQNVPTRFPLLMQALAQGDFELGPDSRLEPLAEAVGQFGSLAAIELELLLDVGDEPISARIAMDIACGLWRWSVPGEGSVSFDNRKPLPLPAGDALVPSLLAGLSLQGGRAATLWAQAVRGAQTGNLN